MAAVCAKSCINAAINQGSLDTLGSRQACHQGDALKVLRLAHKKQ